MIVRIWRGWTAAESADAYERLLRGTIFPGIRARAIPGLRRMELLRREAGAEIEFMTLLWFDDLGAVRAFAGDDYTRAVVPAAAQALLARYDERAAHFDLRPSGTMAHDGE